MSHEDADRLARQRELVASLDIACQLLDDAYEAIAEQRAQVEDEIAELEEGFDAFERAYETALNDEDPAERGALLPV